MLQCVIYLVDLLVSPEALNETVLHVEPQWAPEAMANHRQLRNLDSWGTNTWLRLRSFDSWGKNTSLRLRSFDSWGANTSHRLRSLDSWGTNTLVYLRSLDSLGMNNFVILRLFDGWGISIQKKLSSSSFFMLWSRGIDSNSAIQCSLSPYLKTFKEPRNRFQGNNSATM